MARNGKILVVDDNANARTSIADLLAEVGYEVVVAVDGEEALARVREESLDVALVDARLPGIDGYEVCRQMKEVPGLVTKVIVYTAHIDAVNAAKARESGADDFVGRVSDFANIHQAIEAQLRPRGE